MNKYPLGFLMMAKLRLMLQLLYIYIIWSNENTLIFLSISLTSPFHNHISIQSKQSN